MAISKEVVVLQHRLTEQTVVVALSQYLLGAKTRYRNFKLKGQGQFIAPPGLPLPSFVTAPSTKDNQRHRL